MFNYEVSFHKFNCIKITSCRFSLKANANIYTILTENHLCEYTWRCNQIWRPTKQPDFDPHAVEIISRKLHTA